MPMPLDMTDDEIMAELRGALGQTTSYGVDVYVSELARRASNRQTDELPALTREIRYLTRRLAAATIVALAVSVVAVVAAPLR